MGTNKDNIKSALDEIMQVYDGSYSYESDDEEIEDVIGKILTKYFNPTQEQSENDRRKDQAVSFNKVNIVSGGTTIGGENSAKRTRSNYNPYRSSNVRSEGGTASTSSTGSKRTGGADK